MGRIIENRRFWKQSLIFIDVTNKKIETLIVYICGYINNVTKYVNIVMHTYIL